MHHETSYYQFSQQNTIKYCKKVVGEKSLLHIYYFAKMYYTEKVYSQ